jgi:hypothetical protein
VPKEHSTNFAKFIVIMNTFIAASGVFIPTYNTFQQYNTWHHGLFLFFWFIVIYAVSSSIYSSIKYAKPLINDMSTWFWQALFGSSKKEKKYHDKSEKQIAREILGEIFCKDRYHKLKLFITTIGIITSSFFFFYTLHNTFQLLLSAPIQWIGKCTTPGYLWHVSGMLAVVSVIWCLIPNYALTFREEAKKAKNKILHQLTNNDANDQHKNPTKSFEELKHLACNHDNVFINFISAVVFGLFCIIGISAWIVCASVLSVGTYIGAQHIFSTFIHSTLLCTHLSDIAFFIDFSYQICYYGTELSRKLIT